MRQMFRWILLIGSITATVYRYRYKALDMITKVPYLRKLLVRLSMNIPWIRQRFLSQMFHGR